jgi:dihydropteroate synthase
MAVLNTTPDSFSDGGHYLTPEAAIDRAANMLGQGADIIDVGGESTRPGAAAVSLEQELERVVPVIEAVRRRFDARISIDTSKPEVMRQAVAAGASMINDVNALRAEGATEVAVNCGVPVCLMHMQGQPRTMQTNPSYQDVVTEVSAFLNERVAACLAAGLPSSQLVLDPGFGFGKTLGHNLSLFNALPALLSLGYPVLVGVSRKSMLGQLTGRDVEQRQAASVVAAGLAARAGVQILRVHDVAPSLDALKIAAALRQAEQLA